MGQNEMSEAKLKNIKAKRKINNSFYLPTGNIYLMRDDTVKSDVINGNICKIYFVKGSFYAARN